MLALTYIVIRYPSLPEDEGRTHLLVNTDTKEEAEKYIENYCKDGYFSRRDLGICEVERPQNQLKTMDDWRRWIDHRDGGGDKSPN
jgi:hypothetical protein